MTEDMNSLDNATAESSPGAPAPELNVRERVAGSLGANSPAPEASFIQPSQITPEWPEDRILLLIALWSENWTGSQIANRLGTTRNSICGKISRLGLSKPYEPRPRRRIAGPRVVSRNEKIANSIALGRFAKRAKRNTKVEARGGASTESCATDLPPEPLPATRVSIFELVPGMCKWPIGDPQSPDFCFCGGAAIIEAPYCAAHCRLAYQPPRSRAVA